MSAASALSSAAPHPSAPAPQPVAAAPAGPSSTSSVLNIIAKAVGAAVESGALQAAIKQITK
jgi:hypothetical protein